MKRGEKYISNETIKSLIGFTLFKKGEIYELLDFDDSEVTLNHNLISNEYMSYPKSILNKFTFTEIFDEQNLNIIKSMKRNYTNDFDLGAKIREMFKNDEFVIKLSNNKDLGKEIRKLSKNLIN